jgi:flavin reductase
MADAAAWTPVDRQVARLWPPAETETFRQGLARLASGVAIATCWTSGIPSGVMVSALTSVSVDPPRLLFCLEKTASAHDALIAAPAIGLSLPTAAQLGVARRFSGSDASFDAADWMLDPHAPPELRAPVAAFAGPVRCRIDGGGSTLFILDVSSARLGARDPLIALGPELLSLALQA